MDAETGVANEHRLRRILTEHAGLSLNAMSVEHSADLYAAGMSSRASVSVMLAIESEFELEFPDEMLRREVFASVAAMLNAIDTLTAAS